MFGTIGLLGGGTASRSGRTRFAHRRALGIARHDLDERAVGVVARREERRHVDAGDGGERREQRAAVAPVPALDGVDDLADDLLAVAEQDGVEERRPAARD